MPMANDRTLHVGDDSQANWHERRLSLLALGLMCLAVVAAYFPVRDDPEHNILEGADFYHLHERRIRFAVESLRQYGTLPAWYPAELLGAPFWSNIQSFPFIPTRLLVLALPRTDLYATAVILSAVLSAGFTFAYARRIGLGPAAAAAAGWTFACAGIYAVRVGQGTLPLLEAYPALPLLLWLAELNVGNRPTRAAPSGRGCALRVAGLAIATACVALAGHPQLPIYAMIVAGLYILWRSGGRWRIAARAELAMASGVACAAFALWPMLLLTRRSTRVLPLRREINDLPLPFNRLGAYLFPWKDGWPLADVRGWGTPFTAYPDFAYFYETVNYIGWLPLIACLLLIGGAIVRRKRPSGPAVFPAVVAVVALVTALPPFHRGTGAVGITLLRCPARQTYVTAFGLAMALGAAVHAAAGAAARLGASRGRRAETVGMVVIGAALAAHAVDLTAHNRRYLYTNYLPADQPSAAETRVRQVVGTGRAGIDFRLAAPFNRRIEDVGIFDSIILRRPYVTVLDVNRTPADFNTQTIQASQLRPRTLAALGTTAVMTPARRSDLVPLGPVGDVSLYGVANPTPRVTFATPSLAVRAAPDEMHRMMRDGRYQPLAHILIPPEAANATAPMPPAATPAVSFPSGPTTTTTARALPTMPPVPAAVERPNPDELVVRVRNDESGFLRVLETFDEGWQAEVNGRPADVFAADDTYLGIAVPAGDNTVRFTYQTPGAKTGIAISLAGVAALLVLITTGCRGGKTGHPPEPA